MGARETPTDVLLVQAAIRHPQDDHLHNRAFNRYFSSMRRLAAAMDFNSLVTRAVPSPPTTMLSLAAYLRAQRIRVAVADLNLSFLADGITPETELITRLEQDRPRILAIGAMESYLLEAVYRLARTARDYDPGLYIVVGGVNATAIDAAILKTGK
ncbi:MAG: cobalamin-dependent protein, partial [Desulfobacterales bacterium]